MKKQIVIFLLIVISTNLFAQKLSEETEISILTCSPGPELYTAFGHTAIRVEDPNSELDRVFNYGSFNFNIPNFYLKFVRGQLNYQLALEKYKSFERQYSRDNRDVYAQVLNIDYEQKKSLYKYLIWKSQPENKYYLYDFFFDNCATRVRDVLKDEFGDSLLLPEKDYEKTLRQMLNPYLASRPWMHLGINSVIGTPSDQAVNTHLAIYLPDNLDTVFTNSFLITKDGKIPFVLERRHVIKKNDTGVQLSFYKKYFTPKITFWLFFILVLIFTIIEFFRKSKNYIFDFILTFIFGLAGMIILLTWFGTIHRAADTNLNVLWALPTHVVVAFFILKKKKPSFLKLYFLIVGIYNLLIIATWSTIPQEFDLAILPLILTLSIRYLSAYWYELRIKN